MHVTGGGELQPLAADESSSTRPECFGYSRKPDHARAPHLRARYAGRDGTGEVGLMPPGSIWASTSLAPTMPPSRSNRPRRSGATVIADRWLSQSALVRPRRGTMKAVKASLTRAIERPEPAISLLFYGPDEGGIARAAINCSGEATPKNELCAAVGDVGSGALPTRLERGAVRGKRAIWVAPAGDESAKACGVRSPAANSAGLPWQAPSKDLIPAQARRSESDGTGHLCCCRNEGAMERVCDRVARDVGRGSGRSGQSSRGCK